MSFDDCLLYRDGTEISCQHLVLCGLRPLSLIVIHSYDYSWNIILLGDSRALLMNNKKWIIAITRKVPECIRSLAGRDTP